LVSVGFHLKPTLYHSISAFGRIDFLDGMDFATTILKTESVFSILREIMTGKYRVVILAEGKGIRIRLLTELCLGTHFPKQYVISLETDP